MLADWQSTNAIYGRTKNPWDLGCTPGGSSGGSAAAIAAGLSALEVGSDIGGSIRVPAAFCGVYGHRPSETLLPRSGQFPWPPMPNAGLVMGVPGPMARSAEDLELALAVLAGPEAGEDVAWRVELPAARRARLADFRVAILPQIPWIALDDRIATALDRRGSTTGRSTISSTARSSP
jgi:amidase